MSDSARERYSPTDAELVRALGATIRKRREELGLSQEAVAISAGMDRTYYQHIEAGYKRQYHHPVNPTVFILRAIAPVLGTTMSELVAVAESQVMDSAGEQRGTASPQAE